MGSVIALRENSPMVPGTPTNRSELIDELRHYAEQLQVANRLSEYGRALHSISTASQDAYYYLLQLDPELGTLVVTGFKDNEAEEADRRYAEAEQLVKQAPGRDAVLVSVESVNALGKAYPNYFADTRLFVELMRQALAGRSRTIRLPDIEVKSS